MFGPKTAIEFWILDFGFWILDCEPLACVGLRSACCVGVLGCAPVACGAATSPIAAKARITGNMWRRAFWGADEDMTICFSSMGISQGIIPKGCSLGQPSNRPDSRETECKLGCR